MYRLAAGLLAGLLVLPATGWTQSPLEKYRDLKFPPKDENFDKGWKERVALEQEVISAGDLKSLRAGLKAKSPFVRALAARALGILGDKASADALAELVKSDPEYFVRIRAVESLGYLKMKPEAIELAKKDKHLGVQWSAMLAAEQLKSTTDHAAQVRKAFATRTKLAEMGSAKVGERAPDFTALTSDGKPFKLSSELGKKPIAIYFAAFDG
jgi:hypothetical protein